MKLLTTIFSRLYQYATILIVVGTPLLFIPKTTFAPEVTYHIVMMVLVALALFSYVFTALVTKTWHTVSKLEFISYFVFSAAVILSSLLSKSFVTIFFGEAFNQFSGAALLSLPVVMYLVRSLPENLRQKLKSVIVAILAISSFAFISTLMVGGRVIPVSKALFSGFSSSISFAVYIGLFCVAAFFFVVKAKTTKKVKILVGVTAVIFAVFLVAISSQNNIRPNLKSTSLVGKKVLLENGPFGIGPGNFSRAWQLHRPQDVLNSPYFGYDFSQGDDTMTTLFVTVGIVGLIGFFLLVISALYSTFVSYRENKEGKEHIILGLLTLTLSYFIIVAWVAPLSYSMLVLWMVIAGLGSAKARLTEFHPSKKLAYLFVPVTILLVIGSVGTINKARAFAWYNKAGTATTIEEAEGALRKAVSIYKYDGFYRMLVEYAITSNRNLVATPTTDQEALKNAYVKKSAEAVEAGITAVALNPNNYQNYVARGRAYELAIPFDKEKGFAEAKKAYQDAISLYSGNPYLYLMLARLETTAGTKEGVRESLTEALKKKQNFADALYLMSQLFASESKMDEALTYAIEAVKSAPNDPAVYVQAGLLLYGRRDYQNAVLALRAALERDQNNANIAYFLALTLRDGGRPDLAKPLADELLRRNPGNAELEKFINSLSSTNTSESTVSAPRGKK